MYEYVLDTETTGLDPYDGHRLVEIGCVELLNLVPTGRTYHQYINPERDVPAEAVAVHGLDQKFLADKPVFAEIFTDFLDFLGSDGRLVIHNAEFDMKFINYELKQIGHPGIKMTRVLDTLAMARMRFPGAPATLDALCRRFGVDNSGRDLHGALLDSQLLADVYLELMGGRQHGLGLDPSKAGADGGADHDAPVSALAARTRTLRAPRPHAPSAQELESHQALLEKLTDPIWKNRT